MAVALSTLVEEANRYLNCAAISDYCPNGLQVEGRPQVLRIVSGVTASQALLDAAVEAQADLVLVHHGYFWKGEDPCITGMKQRRLKTLLKHDISLLAYHLPLDLHPEVGNNVQLARQLDITVEGPLDPSNAKVVGLVGSLAEPVTARDFARRVQEALGREPLLIEGSEMIRRVGWCTGGGQGYIDQAVLAGVDLYLSGEASEQTFHSARENDISFIAAGHHATERYGVQALGDTWPVALPLSICSSIARTRFNRQLDTCGSWLASDADRLKARIMLSLASQTPTGFKTFYKL